MAQQNDEKKEEEKVTLNGKEISAKELEEKQKLAEGQTDVKVEQVGKNKFVQKLEG